MKTFTFSHMRSQLPRHYLSDLLEQRLREAIERGDYQETLPGERTLAATFGVSRPVLRQALTKLAAHGWIAQTHGKACRVIKQHERHVDTRTNRVLFHSSHPFHELSAGTMLAYDLLDQALAKAGLELMFLPCQVFRERSFTSNLQKLVHDFPADVRILHQAPAPVQKWFADQSTPCVVMGTPASDAPLPGIDTDFAPAAEHAMHMLQRRGHAPKRIRLMIPSLDLAGHHATLEGFLRAGGERSSLLRHPVETTELGVWLAQEFVPLLLDEGNPPTATITVWPRFTVGLVSGLATRFGIRLPERLSVVCLQDDPAFDMLIPRITRYIRPAESYIQRLGKMIIQAAKGHPPLPGCTRVIPELCEGDSVAPPA